MKSLRLAACAAFAITRLSAQTPRWQPSPGHTQVLIWPGDAPDAQPVNGPEKSALTEGNDTVAGKPYTYVERVTRPTLTVYSPTTANTGVAIVVFPGGGYQGLAIDLEGTEVCDWLTSNGITCVVLKYRVPGNERYPKSSPYPKSGPYPESPIALEDAQRTLGLVRLHATEWHIDPHKIGVLGFSAGGHLVAATSTHFERRVYAPINAADAQSCRPDFAVTLYPGHLSRSAYESDREVGGLPVVEVRGLAHDFGMNPDLRVTHQTPPTFLVQAEDDAVDDIANSLVYFAALKKAGVTAELHVFAHGGHAFGLRRTKQPITRWPELMEPWLKTIGMISG